MSLDIGIKRIRHCSPLVGRVKMIDVKSALRKILGQNKVVVSSKVGNAVQLNFCVLKFGISRIVGNGQAALFLGFKRFVRLISRRGKNPERH